MEWGRAQKVDYLGLDPENIHCTVNLNSTFDITFVTLISSKPAARFSVAVHCPVRLRFRVSSLALTLIRRAFILLTIALQDWGKQHSKRAENIQARVRRLHSRAFYSSGGC
jgi:hypothetical protein